MQSMFHQFAARAALALAAAMTLSVAQAGSFMVDPTRIELAPGKLSATLTIRNDDREPAVIRLEPRAWNQQGDEDLYEATKEVLVTPPIVTVAPGAEQIVRIALRRPLDPQKELTYRLFLQEVAPPPRPGFSGLQVALRISMPIFAKPGDTVAPKSEWKVAYQAREHSLRVNLANSGNAHLQLQEFKFSAPGSDQVLALQQSSVYLLPGRSRDWLLKLAPAVRLPAGKLRLRASTDAGETDTEIEIEIR
jgi:fimbrial chaperone protein